MAKIPGESAWGVLLSAALVLVASLAIEIHQNSTPLDSGFLISGNFQPLAGSSCMLFIVCVWFVLYTKIHRKVHSLADTFGHSTVFLRNE
jgi:hypothetical protein